jgi:hypothetical protein
MHLIRSLRTTIAMLGMVSCALFSTATAAPLDELMSAVLHGGAPTVGEASPRQFLRAYMSILARAQPKEVIWYVNTAVKARPDLAPQIVLATLNVRRPNMRTADRRKTCQLIGDIIQAAVMANPQAAPAIVKVAIEAAPFARDCIIAAAVAAAPDQRLAFVAAANAVQAGTPATLAMMSSSMSLPTIGTINPADYTAPARAISPEQPPPIP